jgi:hypothetical protein
VVLFQILSDSPAIRSSLPLLQEKEISFTTDYNLFYLFYTIR